MVVREQIQVPNLGLNPTINLPRNATGSFSLLRTLPYCSSPTSNRHTYTHTHCTTP